MANQQSSASKVVQQKIGELEKKIQFYNKRTVELESLRHRPLDPAKRLQTEAAWKLTRELRTVHLDNAWALHDQIGKARPTFDIDRKQMHLQQIIKHLQLNMKLVKSDITKCKIQVSQLVSQISACNQRKAAIEHSLVTMKEEKSSACEKWMQAERERSSKEEQLEALQEKINQRGNKLCELHRKRDALKNEK